MNHVVISVTIFLFDHVIQTSLLNVLYSPSQPRVMVDKYLVLRQNYISVYSFLTWCCLHLFVCYTSQTLVVPPEVFCFSLFKVYQVFAYLGQRVSHLYSFWSPLSKILSCDLGNKSEIWLTHSLLLGVSRLHSLSMSILQFDEGECGGARGQ